MELITSLTGFQLLIRHLLGTVVDLSKWSADYEITKYVREATEEIAKVAKAYHEGLPYALPRSYAIWVGDRYDVTPHGPNPMKTVVERRREDLERSRRTNTILE